MKYSIICILCITSSFLTGQDLIGKITPASASNNAAAFYIGDVIVSDDVGFSNLLATLAFGTLVSIEDVEEQFSYQLYPNPTSHEITITSDTQIEIIQIFDSGGREVIKSFERNADVSHLSPGKYLVTINQRSALTFIKH